MKKYLSLIVMAVVVMQAWAAGSCKSTTSRHSKEQVADTRQPVKIYKANILYTPSAERLEVLAGGYIVVDANGRVEGTYPSLPEHLKDYPVTDYGDQLLIPAMNDLHLHAPQYRNTGIAMDMQLLEWLETYTFPEENRFASVDYARNIYSRFVHDLWLHGTMRSSIFASIHPQATMLLADLIDQSGMGAMVGLVGMNRNCPEYLQRSTCDYVSDMRQLIEHLEGMPRVSPILTPRFIPSCTDDMLDTISAIARQYNLPVQSHLSENPSEIEWVKQLQPESANYGDAYYRHGLFGHTPTLMAHCVHTDGEELELMARQGVVAVHCPTSNSNLASGTARVRHLMDGGVKVALGSDISGGNTMSMVAVMQHALQVSKIVQARTQGREKSLTVSEVMWLATKSGGAFFGQIGSFEPGYEFDALVIDDSNLASGHDYTLMQRLERFIYLGTPANITHRYCSGKDLPEPKIADIYNK
ncbi:MAG: amidohydrolase family protein [Muribaculaceae bacterium]|nr:amidohydrolase family protein [Muribaculaceae bacterium]